MLAAMVVILLLAEVTQAADLTVSVTCIEQVPGYEQVVVWFGYSLDVAVENGSFTYIGDVEIIPFMPEQGDYPYAAHAWVSNDDTTFAVGGWSGDEYLYSEAWYHLGDGVPECDGQPTTDAGALTLDDVGIINNPLVNARANACYEPGQICTTADEWTRGWYLIRQQYGLD